MLVVDTSVVFAALVAPEAWPRLVSRLTDDAELFCPHLLDTELLHALRQAVARGEIGDDRATDVLTDLGELALVRYPHWPFSRRAWQLRHNLTPYDAMFVALAEVLEVPLLTCDARLASSSGHDAQVELFAP